MLVWLWLDQADLHKPVHAELIGIMAVVNENAICALHNQIHVPDVNGPQHKAITLVENVYCFVVRAALLSVPCVLHP